LAALAGCVTKQVIVQAPPVAAPVAAPQAPEWVNKGSGAFKDSGSGSVFYGVGSVTGIKNRSLAVEAADAKARAGVAKVMDTYVANLTKSYEASTSASGGKDAAEEQHVENTLKAFSKFTLHGADIVDHYKDADGTMFSLCKLDMSALKKSLEESKELDSKVKEYVRANADKAHDELNAEEAKQH
jgi:hypothetical protein